MENNQNEVTEKVNYDVLRHQLTLIAKEFKSCNNVLEYISEIKNKESFKRAYTKTYLDVGRFFGLDIPDEDEIDKLEDKVDDLERDICKLENELDEYKDRFGVCNNSLSEHYKVSFFLEYSKNYTEWQIEEIHKNGKKILSLQ